MSTFVVALSCGSPWARAKCAYIRHWLVYATGLSAFSGNGCYFVNCTQMFVGSRSILHGIAIAAKQRSSDEVNMAAFNSAEW